MNIFWRIHLWNFMVGLTVALAIMKIISPPRKGRRQRRFVFHTDRKNDAEITAELERQFAPTKDWC